MMMSRFNVVGIVAGFIAGFLVHLLWLTAGSNVALDAQGVADPSSIEDTGERLSARSESGRREPNQRENISRRELSLTPEVVNAILSGGSLNRKLARMGFSDEQVSAIDTIKTDGLKAFMLIEKERAELISDYRGEFIQIPAFPLEQKRWLESLEADLRVVVGDDRAAVIARMIMFTDNDEAVGLYRREVFITDPPDGDDRMRIEERTFNGEGQLIDTDYDIVLPNSQTGRWGHLLGLSDE